MLVFYSCPSGVVLFLTALEVLPILPEGRE
nr:MAG TPA: hypothetical protein [Caudoviricetes sp.]